MDRRNLRLRRDDRRRRPRRRFRWRLPTDFRRFRSVVVVEICRQKYRRGVAVVTVIGITVVVARGWGRGGEDFTLVEDGRGVQRVADNCGMGSGRGNSLESDGSNKL